MEVMAEKGMSKAQAAAVVQKELDVQAAKL
jgi:hypothetical protein